MALVGRIARAHGIKGQVIVNLETDFPEQRFREGAELFVRREGRVEALTITAVRFHRNRPVIGLRGIDDLTLAVDLAGLELRVPVEWLTPLADGTFYRHDLVGCSVEAANGSSLGVVTDVEGEMGGSRLVVETSSGEVLVPFAREICTTIDVPGRRIVIVPPEGLLELNAHRHRHHLSGDGRAGLDGRDRRPGD